MVQLGSAHGVRTTALLTDMSSPLGSTAGNALEVSEAVECLRGQGPADLREVTLALADEMLALSGVQEKAAAALDDGRALAKYEEMIRAQGGDPAAALPEASERRTIAADADGYLHKLDARSVGVAAWRLGAGRARKEDTVEAAAGVVCLATPGDHIEQGQPLLELHADDPHRFDHAEAALAGGIVVGRQTPEPKPLIIERIEA